MTNARKFLLVLVIGLIATVSLFVGRANAASGGQIKSGCGADHTGYVTFTASAETNFISAIQPEIDRVRKEWIKNTIDPNGNGFDYLSGVFGSVTFTGLAPGTHTWDWYDKDASGTEHGPHGRSGGADEWRGAAYFTFEIPADCVPPVETTTTLAPTTTAVAPTTTVGSATTVAPTTTQPTATTPGSVDTTAALTTPPVVETTDALSQHTLPATGSATGSMLGLGAGVLGLGLTALLVSKRRTAQA